MTFEYYQKKKGGGRGVQTRDSSLLYFHQMVTIMDILSSIEYSEQRKTSPLGSEKPASTCIFCAVNVLLNL